jgi:predicted Rossmann fold nucleotide-binding protein DprA/Smf involved in DNA uptake
MSANKEKGVVSGGAKGIDEAAMLGALEEKGTCIGILTDGLIKRSTSLLYRNYIIDKRLILISPYYPDAGFNAGNAMNRNKLIYAMSDMAIVVKSDTTGGTWEGAKENIKYNWTPLWVCQSEEKGNQEIVKLGGRWLSATKKFMIEELLQMPSGRNENTLFTSAQAMAQETLKVRRTDLDFFSLFIVNWFNRFKNRAVDRDEISEAFQLTSRQVDAWLELGLSKKTVARREESNNYLWYLLRPIEVID